MSSVDLNKISDYQTIFTWFCDIYQLPILPTRNKAVESILSHPQSQFKFYTQFSRLFEAFKDLINNKIELEQFMSLWDLEQQHTRLLNRTMTSDLNSNLSVDTIVVADKVLITLYPSIKSNHTVIEL